MSPLPSRDERRQAGAAARSRVPLSAHAGWQPAPDRPDPVALLEGQAASRVQALVPIRYGRMAISPFTFYRGAALPMAADLAATPGSGIVVQLCGDAHLSNFGLFASPERDLVFDINDFDETLHGPFEWDVKRLAASVVVAGRSRGFDAHETRHAAHLATAAYRQRMAAYADMRGIDVYYSRVDVAAILAYVDHRARPFLAQTVKSAQHHDALHELPKLTAVDAQGRRRIVDHPPIITHPPEATPDLLRAALAGVSRHRPRGPPRPPRPLRARRRGPQGGRGGKRGSQRVRRASPRRRRRPALPPGQAGGGVGAGALPPAQQPAEPRCPRGCRPAPPAGDERRAARLGRRGSRSALVHPPAPGPEGRRHRGCDDARRPGHLGRAVRLGSRARARPLGPARPRSPATSARTRRSTTPSATSRPPTPTRTSATTRRSWRRSRQAGSPPSPASDDVGTAARWCHGGARRPLGGP